MRLHDPMQQGRSFPQRAPFVLVGALVAVGHLGCGHEAAEHSATVVDSAGITLVANSQSSMASAPAVAASSEPVWTTKGLSGDTLEELYRVEDAATIPTGEIAALTQQAVRVYSRDGVAGRQLGRPGRGPGEFTRAVDLVIIGDSLVVFDWPEQRLSIYGADGELYGTIRIARPLTHPGLLSVFEDGSFLIKEDLWQGRPTTFTPIDRRYMLFSPRGLLLDSIGRHPFAEIGWIPTPGVRTTKTFGRVASSTGGSDGYWATTGDSEAIHFDLNGVALKIIRWETQPREVTSQDLATHIERSVEVFADEMQPAVRARLENTPVAEHFPAAGAIVLSLDGKLWIEEYRPVTSPLPARWMIFDTTGAIEKWVTLPPRTTLYEAGNDYVIVKAVDDLNVEHVEQYRLVPAGQVSDGTQRGSERN